MKDRLETLIIAVLGLALGMTIPYLILMMSETLNLIYG